MAASFHAKGRADEMKLSKKLNGKAGRRGAQVVSLACASVVAAMAFAGPAAAAPAANSQVVHVESGEANLGGVHTPGTGDHP